MVRTVAQWCVYVWEYFLSFKWKYGVWVQTLDASFLLGFVLFFLVWFFAKPLRDHFQSLSKCSRVLLMFVEEISDKEVFITLLLRYHFIICSYPLVLIVFIVSAATESKVKPKILVENLKVEEFGCSMKILQEHWLYFTLLWILSLS